MDISTLNKLRKVAQFIDPQRKLRKSIRRLSTTWAYRNLDILPVQRGNELIAQTIASGTPASIGKIGASELKVLNFYIAMRPGKPYPESIREQVLVGPGVFPTTDEAIDAFCRTYLDAISQLDILAPWYNPGEINFIRKFASDAKLVELNAIEPYYSPSPWSRTLHGKKVLLITSFPKTAASQYERRRDVWKASPQVLPDFDLDIIQAPSSPALAPPAHASWQAALDDLKEQMTAVDYDVALIGAGALALPLGAHARSQGKIGVHLGGAVQILFGIKGARWDNHPVISRLFNESWVRPNAEEVPKAAKIVENGAYW
ncbi:hypothetical protein ACFFP0_15575 [Rhizobium puerariae]|uniref:Uncharacterized protein n=1 Tax=Rhizobium puerariae TaxID=1585791 RepID=A0ABV6AKS3_9HYPH